MLNLLLNRWIDRLAERVTRGQEQAIARAVAASSGVKIIGNSNLGYRRIGDTLTFFVATSLQTGARSDADSAPTYLVYEEENATQIVTSTSMALLDSSDTDGLYSEQITLAEATGYEFQKDYLIYITATVSSIVSHGLYSFRIGPEGAVDSANAQAGAAGTITLKSGASATDDIYNGMLVVIIGGTGAGQARTITDYVGSTKVATIEPNWITNPSSSSIYALYHHGRVAVHTGGIVAASFGAGAIDAAAIATGAIDADAIADNAIDAGAIAADAITAAKIATGAIDADAIADNAIDAGAIASGAITSAKFAAGAITATVIATDAIDADALAADAVAEIQSGLATSAAVANIQSDTDDIQTRLPASLNGGRMRSHVEAMDNGTITAAVIATGAVDADALATDAVAEIRAGMVSASGTSDSGSTTTMVDAARTEADTDYWKGQMIVFTSGTIAGQARLITAFDAATDTITFAPATTQAVATQTYEIWPLSRVDLGQWLGVTPNALISGRPDVNVGAMQAGTVTAAAVATDAIDADALAADAVAEIQSGLATAAAVANIQSDTDDIQTRLPATLNGGRMRSHVEAMDAGTITAAVIATDAIDADAIADNAIDAGAIANGAIDAATFAAGAIDAAAIANGAIDAATFAAGAITAAAIATDAIDADALAADAVAEIQAGLATAAAVANIQSDTDDIQTRLPATLNGGRMRSHVEAMDAGTITAAVIATGAIDADALAEDAAVEIIAAFSGTADSGTTTTLVDAALTQADADYWAGSLLYIRSGSTAGQIRRITDFDETTDTLTVDPAFTQAISTNDYSILRTAIGTSAAAAGTDWTSGERDQIRQALGVSGSTAPTTGTGTLETAIAGVQSDTNDIQTRLPATLSGGRMRSQVEGLDAGTITATVIATDAIDADALATDAVTEIQSGLATAVALAAVQADTDDIQTRLPATLVGGRMRSHVEAMDAGTITAAVIATDAIDADAIAATAVTEIQAGLATAAAVAAVQADTDDIQTRLPASLVGGRMRSHVEAMDAGTITAAVIATDAVDADALAADAVAEIVAAIPPGSADWTLAERQQIRQALGVTGAAAATTGAGTLELAAAALQADTDDIQGRLPATLNAGRMRSHVEDCDPPCQGGGGGGGGSPDPFEGIPL